MTNTTNMNLLHVSAPGRHPYGVFHIKGVQTQNINLGMHHHYWNE